MPAASLWQRNPSQNRSLYGISSFVVALHLGLLTVMAYPSSKEPIVLPKRQMVVQTIALNEKKPQAAALETKEKKSVQPASDAKQSFVALKQPEKAALKKSSSEVVKPKDAAVKKNPVVKNQAPSKAEIAKAKQKELIAQAEKSIGQVRQAAAKSDAVKNQSNVPQKTLGALETMHAETLQVGAYTQLDTAESLYREQLAAHLKHKLRLPVSGEVEIELLLARSGKVLKLNILKAENEKNRAYVKEEILKLMFPSFGRNFGKQMEYSFIIVLSSDL